MFSIRVMFIFYFDNLTYSQRINLRLIYLCFNFPNGGKYQPEIIWEKDTYEIIL